MGLKGAFATEMTVGSITKLIMVVVVAIGFVLFITAVGTKINQTGSGLCDKYPEIPFCSAGVDELTAVNDMISLHSVNALQCAIQSAWNEQQESCSSEINQLEDDQDLRTLTEMNIESDEITIPDNLAQVRCFETAKAEDYGKSVIIEYDGGITNDNVCYQYVEGTGWTWSDCKEEFASILTGDPPGVRKLGLVHQWLKNEIVSSGKSIDDTYYVLLSKIEYLLDTNEKNIEYNGESERISNDRIRIRNRDGSLATSWHGKNDCVRLPFDYVTAQGGTRTVYEQSCLGTEHDLTYYLDYYVPTTPQDRYYVSCKVSAFYLPQKVEGAKKWISGYGDPEYIVYWQDFPVGEDASWSKFTSWSENAVTLLLFTLPAGKILKGAKSYVIGTGKTLANKIGGVLSKEGEGLVAKLVGKLAKTDEAVDVFIFEKETTKIVRRAAIEEAARKGFFKEVLDNMNKYYYGPSLTKLFKRAAVTGGAAWLAAYVDSLNEKYEKVPVSLVMKVPFVDPSPFAVNELALNPTGSSYIGIVGNAEIGSYPFGFVRPVILHKPEAFQDDNDFYLASPCMADLEIEKETIYCSRYTYDSKEMTFECEEPVERETAETMNAFDFKSITPCASVPVGIDAIENNRLFSDRNNDGNWDEVIVYGLISDIDWLKIIDKDFDGTFDGYEAKVGSSTVVSTGAKKGQIDVQSDGTFDYDFEIVEDGTMTMMNITDEYGAQVENTWEQSGAANDLVVFSASRQGTGTNILMGVPIVETSGGALDPDMQLVFLHGTSLVFTDPADPGPHPLEIRDTTGDGKLDSFSMGTGGLLVKDTTGDGYWNYYDEDGTGNPDIKEYDRTSGTISSTYCSIEGIVITPDKDPYGKTIDGPNFCYTRSDTKTQFAILTATVIADVVIEVFSEGMLSHIAIGVAGFGAQFASQQVREWP